MSHWRIREERSGDEAAIAALVVSAFRNAPHSDGSEARIVDDLRRQGDLTLSLVTVNMDCAIIGHAAISPVGMEDGSPGWFGLGPVAVIPLRQRAGIGSAMIEEAISRLTALGAAGCVVLGDPAYYGRFGFRHDPRLSYEGAPPEYFQRLLLRGPMPTGQVRYAAAFG